MKLCYEESSFLIYGAFTIKSTEGFQQGYPLATFGFCLVPHPALQNLLSKLKTGYLDDVAFADEWRTTLHDLPSIKQACAKLGLFLNEKKCEVTSFGSSKKEIERAFCETFPTIQCVDAEDSTLLGAGLGTKSIRAALVDKLAKLKTLLQRTASLPCQTAFFLIKNCFYVPKLMYVLRASPALNTQIYSTKSTHLYALNLRESSTASIPMSLSVKFACPRNKEGLVFKKPALSAHQHLLLLLFPLKIYGTALLMR